MKAREAKEVEIIRLLKASAGGGEGGGGFVSGEALSRALGVSRTAVWKHVNALRKMGYGIEAVPSKGYRLGGASAQGKASLKGAGGPAGEEVFNGVEISSGLTTDFIGKNIFFYDAIDSTNIKAIELGRSGTGEGTAVVADSQTSGKGRIGRRWESPPGVNLYTSIILRPGVSPSDAQALTLLAAVAVAEAVSVFIPRPPVVKWPNDILIGSKKVAGILMEMDAEADRVEFIVAGIGINVNMDDSMLPEELRRSATSLKEAAGGAVSRVGLARTLYSRVEKWYKIFLREGRAPVIEAWKGFFAFEGRPVRVLSFRETLEGICMGVDEHGMLLVRRPSGEIERVISGDVEEVRSPGVD
ncbi:MAG TPA: biotin--[acetyl-CoA-carboxylase] ligase [Thermodesulfobacteriota bacterium]|nr:biotin--[acetyl-CoA-carboxylase] ligase [Thermodesulfobacteriota bacterium]